MLSYHFSLNSMRTFSSCIVDNIECSEALTWNHLFQRDKRIENREESATRETSQDVMDVISFV